ASDAALDQPPVDRRYVVRLASREPDAGPGQAGAGAQAAALDRPAPGGPTGSSSVRSHVDARWLGLSPCESQSVPGLQPRFPARISPLPRGRPSGGHRSERPRGAALGLDTAIEWARDPEPRLVAE